MLRSSALVACVTCHAGTLLAQTVHLVGPGGFPTILDAVIAAAPGDIIHVLPGTYTYLSAAKDLTIRALTPGTVAVTDVAVLTPPPNQTVHVVGIRFFAAFASGSVTFDECTIDGAAGSCFIVNGGRVHLQDCVVTPPTLLASWMSAPAMHVTNSDVTMVDSHVEGVDGIGITPPSEAIELIGSTLRGSGLLVRGGNGSPTVPAIVANATSRVWLSDSTVQGDVLSCPLSASQGRHDRCTLTPNCSGIPAGSVLGTRRLAPPQSGGAVSVEFRAGPNAPIGVVAALHLQHTLWPELEQSLLMPVATAFPLATLIANPVGLAAGSWPIPAAPAVVDRGIWLQAFGGTSWPLQASAVVGGVIR